MPWRVHVVSSMANFRPQGAHPRIKRAHPRLKMGPSKIRWVNNVIFGRVTLDQGPFNA